MQAWIGLGGNSGNSRDLLADALALLAVQPGVTVLRRSRCYRTPPWGMRDQPEFVNAVAEVATELSPLSLLHVLVGIERRLGRVRTGPRWGPRPIDLDLLTYNELELQSDELELPHPRMHLRAFVLVPLLEVEPEYVIPGQGAALDCLNRIDPSERAAVVPLPTPWEVNNP
jgi:2-amino-4-hydroxy-6-hydroxymethyldihydropteridine diphosphokinase